MSRSYDELVNALMNDKPNDGDSYAAANAICRLQTFREGALRALKDRGRIEYGWNSMQYGYFAKDGAGVRHWATEFRCVACGHADHADMNAARNIRCLARASVNTPKVSEPHQDLLVA